MNSIFNVLLNLLIRVYPNVRRKYRLWESYLDGALEILRKTDSQEVREILAFLLEYAFLTRPKGAALARIQRIKRPVVPVVIMTDKSDETAPNWEKLATGHFAGAAVTISDQGVLLVLKSHHEVSPPWKGLLLLHEGLHVLRFHTSEPPRTTWTFEDRTNEELHIYTLECKLASLYFGTSYDGAIQRIALERFHSGAFNKQAGGMIELNVTKDWLAREVEALAPIIGTPLSEVEKLLQAQVVFVHVYFTLIKLKVKEGADEFLRMFVARECVS